MRKHKIGQRVRVVMGVNAGMLATIVSMARISIKGCGTPNIGRGHYKPITKNDRAIQYVDGTFDVHDVGNLKIIPNGKYT